MKRNLYAIIVLLLFGFAGWAQDTFFSSGDVYQVYSDVSQDHANKVLAQLEAYTPIFEDILHYDRAKLSSPLKVKIKGSAESYQAYVADYVDSPKDIFLFLQYTDPVKSELIGYDPDDGTFETKLIHHAFIQYLKAFIPNPPLWLQKGLAIYLEKSYYSSVTDTAEYAMNMEWTKTLKKYLIETPSAGKLSVGTLLSIDVDTANANIQEFYAQSWGVVHFLLNSDNKRYNRIIWDILDNLQAEYSREENQSVAMEKGFGWVTKDAFVKDYTGYVAELKTFADLVREGIALYSEKSFNDSLSVFNKAIAIDANYNVPYYYLGLLHYEMKDYPMAEYYYQESLERGSDPNLTYYAMGIAAYSESSYDRALDYLNLVVEGDPEGYGVKAQELIEKIDSEMTDTTSGA